MGISYGGANLYLAARNGGTIKGYHWRFLDEPEREPGQLRGNRSVICWETGVIFETAEAAATWAGTDVNGIYASLNFHCSSGGYHWYLHGTPKPDASIFKTGQAVVCVETSEVFESINAAARAVGLKTGSRICTAIKNGSTSGGYHWYRQGDPKPDALQLKNRELRKSRAVACWETDEVFASADEAAKAVGLKSSSCIRAALRKTQTTAGGYHWYYADSPKSEMHPAPEQRRKPREVACVETGEVFSSADAAAKAVGLKSSSGIRAALRKKQATAGGYHWRYADAPEPETLPSSKHGRKPRAVACWETDEVFASADEAATAVGVAHAGNIRAAVRNRYCTGGYHWYRPDQPKPKESELKQTKRKNSKKSK